MDTAIQPVTEKGLTEVALAVIVAKYARRAHGAHSAKRWALYERAKDEIDRLNPTPDEYETAIRLLTKALQI